MLVTTSSINFEIGFIKLCFSSLFNRCELEESNRTLKAKYEKEVSDMMIQMEDVQQKQQEVLQQEKRQFEEHQKKMFEKQLSEVKEELEPYKDKCLTLEKENKELMNKYEQDLCELKTKLDEVEERYRSNEPEEGNMQMLKQELELYREKVSKLESGNRQLVENYETQISNMKRSIKKIEEDDLKVLNEEVKVYQEKIEKLQEEKMLLKENCDCIKIKLELIEKECKIKDEEHKAQINEFETLMFDLRKEIDELGKERERNNEENSRLVSENEKRKSSIVDLERELASNQTKHEEEKKKIEDLVEEYESSKKRSSHLESENEECRNKLSDLQQRLHFYEDECSHLQEETANLIKEIQELNHKNNEILTSKREIERVVNEVTVQLDALKEIERSLLDEKENYLQEAEAMKSKLENQDSAYQAAVSQKNDLEKEVYSLKEEMVGFRDAKERAKNEIEVLQQSLNTLSEELGNKKEGNNSTMREIENLNESLQAMMISLENSRKEQEQVKSEKEDLSETLIALREELKTDKEEMHKVNMKNKLLEEQLSAAMNELKSNKSKLSQLQEKKKKSDNKLGAQIQRLMMTVRNLEGDVRGQEKICQQLEEDKKQLFSKHEIEVNELMEKIESLETDQWKLRKVEEDKNNIEKEMAGLRNNLTCYQTKLSEMEGLSKAKIEKKQDEEDSLQEEVRQLEKTLEQREKELKLLRNKLKEVKIEKEATDRAHKEEMTALKIVLKAFEGSAEDELFRVSSEKYNCEIENANLKKELSLTKYSLDEHQTRNTEYEEEIAILVRDVERLKALANESKSLMNESFTTEKQNLCEEIEILRKDLEDHKNHVIELEEEGNHSFGVLLSQHEKELETLKEELEDQIARKREQLAKDAAAKRQKLREEYEGKVRILYDELVAEKQKTKDQQEANKHLTVKVNKLEENKSVEARLRKELEENIKTLTENLKKLKEFKVESLKKEQEYKDRIQILEQEIRVLKISSKNAMQENDVNDEPHVKEEKVNALQVELSHKNEETVDFQERLEGGTIQETRENFENELVLQKEIENLQTRLQENQREYGGSIKSLEKDKERLQEELQKELELKQLLQKEVKERDSARDAVVQKYDLRMEELALELESANCRTVESHKNLQDMKNLFATKQNEWKAQVDQLTTEKENLLAEHKSNLKLERKVQQLELQLSETFGELASRDNEMESSRELKQQIKLLEEQVSDEKNHSTKLQLIIELNKNEMTEDKTKLREILQLVEEKDKVIEECKNEIKQMEEKLQDDINMSVNRQKELESHLKNQTADYSNSLERVKKDLKQEYEESNIQLKKNYENIFARMEEEQKAKVEEMETEIETLKGMVDNLEQLNQLKDEEQEVLMREQAKNLESEINQLHSESLEHQNEIAKLKMDKKKISDIVEKQLAKITKEKDLLSSEHEVTLLELKDRLSLEYSNQIKELSNQIKLLEDANQNLKKDYEKEIDSLQKQLSFETSCQFNLQTEHDKELSEQKELLQKQHKLDVETFNSELQEKTRKLELVRSEYQEEVRVLSVKLEELNHELETLKNDLASKYEYQIARLQNDLEAKSSELDKREAEHINKVQMLSQKIQNMSEKHSCKENEELQKIKSGYELLISSLRTENQALGDKNNKLKKDLENTLTAHLKHDEDIKADLERKYKYQLDKLNKKHAGELDSLMQKLESLIRQENASKSMTEEHMKGIEVLRKEFDKKLERITREKRKELESAQRILEQQYKMAIAGLNKEIVSKEAENNRYKRQVRELEEQVASLKKVNQGKQFNQDDLMRLRRENTELCIKLREEISRNHLSPENDNSKKQIEKLKGEIDSLKMANKDLQFALDQSSIFSENEVESLSSDRNRLLQLIKLMEQLMMEKNTLELKLRKEIKDLKTRFGANIDSLNEISSSPFLEKSLTSDGLDTLLSEFNENKLKQEEDIKTNVAEIENMIEDVKKRLGSTALTDRKTRNVLERQVEHLEEQRELMVDRLRQLGEKHRSLQEKITRQMEEQNNKSSPGNYARTRYYENLFEENLRRERELLSLKRKQVEDLQQRLSFEKTALEKHVADKRKFQREILEKDKLETVLSSERNELERKWIGKLKEKELELKQEKVALESKREHINSILSDNHYKSRRIESTESHSLQQENTQKLENASFRERKRSVNKGRNDAETVHFKYKNAASSETKIHSIVDYGNLRRRVFDETKTDITANSVNLQESRKPKAFDDSFLSSNTRFSVKVREDLYEVKIPPASLDTSQESNSEVNIYEELSLDFDTGDSDAELYETHSLELLDDLDPNWEKNLEEDLKRISAGELITDSETVTAKRPIDKYQTRIPRMSIGRSQSDSLIRVKKSEEHMSVVTSSKVIQDDTSLSRPSGFTFAVDRQHHSPRTSTAVGSHSPDRSPFTANGFQNISHIPTVLPNLFRQLKYKGSSPNTEKSLDTEDRRVSGISNTLSSDMKIPDADNSRVQSPSSLSSEIVKGTTYREIPGYRGQEKSRTLSPSMFLINIEDFVDRHTVQYSDDVASLREPSPSEKRHPS